MTAELFKIVENGSGREEYVPVHFDGEPPPADDPTVDEINEELEESWSDFAEEPEGVTLRPYQDEAVESILAELYGAPAVGDEPAVESHASTLLVMSTGLGKTVIAAEVLRRRKPGKALLVAHRTELIYQAKATFENLTGEPVTVEKAERYARMDANIVVASVQTLISGMAGDGRMIAFYPGEFSLVIFDEAHHSVAASWMRVAQYFQQNSNCKLLGLTATPDRADENALGKVYNSVAMTYEIGDAIRDGWLVPLSAIPIRTVGLDYSSIRTTAGDLNGADLAHVMEVEAPLHQMAQGMMEAVCQAPQDSLKEILDLSDDDPEFHREMDAYLTEHPLRKTLVFCASVVHAEMFCEIVNRWIPGRAAWVCGKTPKDHRKKLFEDYKTGKYMFLFNVSVCTEGYDEPTIEVIVMARPTKSRALYSQMVGRGTRALAGVVDGPETPEERRAAIAASGKKCLDIIDFVGVVGRHVLMTPADILGGNYEDAVVDRANKNMNKSDRKPSDVSEDLEKAREEIEEEKAREAARRAKVRVAAKYVIGASVDPMKMFKVTPYRERGWEKGKEVTGPMKASLERQKLWREDMPYSEARQIIQGMADRRKKGLSTYRQAKVLAKNGLPTEVPFGQASSWIDRIAAARWKVPPEVKAEAQAFVQLAKKPEKRR